MFIIKTGYVIQGRRHAFTIGGGGGGGGGGGQDRLRLHFSAIRMGSRGAFVLLHCKFQMYEDCRSRAAVLLSCSNFAHERNTYVHGILDCMRSRSQAVRF